MSQPPDHASKCCVPAAQMCISDSATWDLSPAVVSISEVLVALEEEERTASKTFEGERASFLGLQWKAERSLYGWQVVTGQATSYGCSAEIDWHEDWHPIYLPTINDKKMYEFSKSVAER